jgi:MinD-like ATPase involved in chromosome partitioning or flagellar assembly
MSLARIERTHTGYAPAAEVSFVADEPAPQDDALWEDDVFVVRDTEAFARVDAEELPPVECDEPTPLPPAVTMREFPAVEARVPPPVELPAVEISFDEPLADSLDRATVRARKIVAPTVVEEAPGPVATREGQLTVMFGCHGGSGATTLAVNLAGALAAQKKEVCVVDLDLQLGDVLAALDLPTKASIAGLAREVASLDENGLKRRLARHASGFYALAQTGRLEEVDDLLTDQLPELLALLKRHFDHVIVDGVRDFDDCALAALDVADHIALVVTQDVAAVRRAARIAGLCRQLKYPERKLRLVVNRERKSRLPEIERALGLPVRATVAQGPRRRMQRDLVALPSLLPEEPPAKPGFWARLFS